MLYVAGEYSYKLIENWAKLPKGWTFDDIGGLAVDSQDRLYVLNRSIHPVMVFDPDGNLLVSWGEAFFQSAHGVCLGNDNVIYCVDDGAHAVYKFTTDGKLLQTLGSPGKPSDTGYVPSGWDFFWRLSTIEKSGPPFNRPTGVALAPSGEIYVSDGYGNASIHRFSPDGTLLSSFGKPGSAPGEFKLPHSIFIDHRNRVWVLDRENNRIQLFSLKGEFLNEWRDFIRPTDVWIDKQGMIYVSELCLRLSIFSSDGRLLARWGNEVGEDKEMALFLAPHTIAVDSHGDIYVGDVSVRHAKLDRGSRNLRKFVRNK